MNWALEPLFNTFLIVYFITFLGLQMAILVHFPLPIIFFPRGLLDSKTLGLLGTWALRKFIKSIQFHDFFSWVVLVYIFLGLLERF
jgi:hypothetical protein